MKKIIIVAICIVAIFTEAFAAQFNDVMYGRKCIKDDFSYAKSEWVTIDADGDGYAEYYYFNSDGFLVVNQTTPDGYKVNGKGQYVVDGVVQTKKLETANVDADGTNYIISKKKENDITESKQDVFVDVGDNTNGTENDPNTIQPKVRKAMDLAVLLSGEDGDIIVPFSKKEMKAMLQLYGYKKSTIDRALSEVKINWKEHALIWARHLHKKGFTRGQIRERLREIDEFSSDEVKYALDNLEANVATRKYVDPAEYVGLSDEEKMAKLFSLGFNEEQVKQALVFINDSQ
ncbi:MAG: hypothetical protein IKP66_06365 [Lachnospiraceae bacterium]|nr:hypothetical protein [Lachnospiraceae bacterium]